MASCIISAMTLDTPALRGLPPSAILFVDFWNLTLEWSNRSQRTSGIDWWKLPKTLWKAAVELGGDDSPLRSHTLDGTRVYASTDVTDRQQGPLRRFLNTTLASFPGFTVHTRDRRPRPRPVHCRECGHELAACPECSQAYRPSAEKGVDAAVVTDMLSMAWAGALGVAILASSDADFIPAVECLQSRGIRVVNATWRNYGYELRQRCWASFEIDRLMPECARQIPTRP